MSFSADAASAVAALADPFAPAIRSPILPVQMYFSSEVRAEWDGLLYLFLEKVKSGASIRITNSLGLMVPLAAWSEWVGSKDVRGWMTSTLLGCCYDIHPVL